MKEHPKGISIILCTYNGAGRLRKTLASLAKQENIERIKTQVIFVDNASTDNSATAAQTIWN